MRIILVQVRVKPEAIAAFIEATRANAAASLLEPGVARFDIVQQTDDPARFVLVEVYRDAEAPVRHKATPHYAVWRDAVAPMMAEGRTGVTYTAAAPDLSGWA